MRTLLLPSLLLAAMSGGVGATYVSCPGCIDRNRVNATCEWSGDSTFSIDLQNGAHRQHLINDAQLAEDLAVRYADAEHKRLFGWAGHGGLIDQGRVLNECMARLFAAVEGNHGVTMEHVAVARGQRNQLFDLAVGLTFLPLYCFVATTVAQVSRRRFLLDERYVGIAATGLTSVAVSVLGLHLGQLWLMIWETIRVGNGHIGGFRLASYQHPWRPHVGALFIGGVLLFWLIALYCYRIASNDEQTSTDVGSPHGILLR